MHILFKGALASIAVLACGSMAASAAVVCNDGAIAGV